MKKRGVGKFLVVVAIASIAAATLLVKAQSRPGFALAEGVEAINQARVATRILYITAHPDDEDSGLLAYLADLAGAVEMERSRVDVALRGYL